MEVTTEDIQVFRYSLVNRINFIGDVLEQYPHIAYLPLEELRKMSFEYASPDYQLATYLYRLRRIYNDIKTTINVIDTKSKSGSFVRFQSSILEMTGAQDTGEVRTNEVFQDSTVTIDDNVMQLGHDEKEHGEISVVTMSKFLSRPISIYSGAIAMGASGAYLNIDPWTLWSSTPSVLAKLRNFAYFKGHLKLRFALSGTPFHYGRLLVSYQPFYGINDSLGLAIVEGSDGILCYTSQAPGSFMLAVNANITHEITLPFIWQYNMLRLYNTASTVVSAFDDFADMGHLFVTTVGVVGSVSTTPTAPYLQIYAWCDDVELGTSTATVLSVPAEAKVASNEHDERVSGPVERFASSMVNMLNPLKSIPTIAPYAMASSMMMSGVQHMSSILGWSKPVPVNSLEYVKNEPYRNGANIIGLDTAHRLTLDPLQELTVDQSCVESTTDDMSFKEICGRLSYYRSFKWNSTDVPMTPIFQQAVTPMVATAGAVVNSSTFSVPTALCFAATPFTYWHGEITYRVVINSSKFHRGKLMVFYEPNFDQSVLINAAVELNKNFQLIVDIAETSEFEFTVKWAKEKPWLRIGPTSGSYKSYTNNLHTYTPSDWPNYANGYIGICPFTELQSPDGSPVYVNMFVKSDDMHFNGLFNVLADYRRGLAPGDVLEVKAESQSYDVVPEYTLNESTAKDAHISIEHFGEEPFSFRALLKRYVTVHRYSGTPNPVYFDSNGYFQHILPIVYNNNSPAIGTGGWGPSNDLLSYLRQAYVGMRGSIRQRVLMLDPDQGTLPVNCQVRVGLVGESNSDAAIIMTPYAQYSDSFGSTTFAPYTNNGVEVELPFYAPVKFRACFAPQGATSTIDPYWFRNFKVVTQFPKSATKYSTIVDAASGEDFTLMRFQGAIPFNFNSV